MTTRVSSKLIACACVLVGLPGLSARGGEVGPDVVYSDCQSVWMWGAIGGVRAYSLGTSTCNIGDMNLLWGSSNNGTPAMGMNAYRLHGGRLVQIGQGWAKKSTVAAAGSGCGLPCNGQGGSVLGVGCRDVYSASYNGSQSLLQRRSDINAYSGVQLPAPGGSGSTIDRRLQIAEGDLSSAAYPEAQYFVEGVYVGSDDAAWGNAHNNASYKRVTVGGDFSLNVTGPMAVAQPAIFAWRDHGDGPGVPDPDVDVFSVVVPGEGRFYIGTRTTGNGDGTWHYEYAIFNLNSHRSAGSLRVPVSPGTVVSNVGFHDVDYHSGEIYDNTDWTVEVGPSAVSWRSPQTHAQNPSSNALRWGTLYNFWFDANRPPAAMTSSLGLFIPGSPSSIGVPVPAPGKAPCPWDLDGGGDVGIGDLLALLAAWGPGKSQPADFDGDGAVGIADLLTLLEHWGPCP
jgi:hypothetical protein